MERPINVSALTHGPTTPICCWKPAQGATGFFLSHPTICEQVFPPASPELTRVGHGPGRDGPADGGGDPAADRGDGGRGDQGHDEAGGRPRWSGVERDAEEERERRKLFSNGDVVVVVVGSGSGGGCTASLSFSSPSPSPDV